MELGYRSSVIQRRGYIVTEAVFQLHKGNKEQILGRMSELNAKRREKQPLDYPSAGSTFKRPEGYFAGKLIQEAGLAGGDFRSGTPRYRKSIAVLLLTGARPRRLT